MAASRARRAGARQALLILPIAVATAVGTVTLGPILATQRAPDLIGALLPPADAVADRATDPIGRADPEPDADLVAVIDRDRHGEAELGPPRERAAVGGTALVRG